MRRQTLILSALLLGISAWLFWARISAPQDVTLASERAALPISPQPVPAQIETDWPTFTHSTWGISFRHHPEWTATIPDFEELFTTPKAEAGVDTHDSSMTAEQEEHARTLGHIISLLPLEDAGWDNAKIEIVLSNYTLSPEGTLEEWVSLINQRSENGSPYTLEFMPVDEQHTPATADEALYAIRTDDGIRNVAIWVSRRELVYGIIIYGDEAGVIEQAQQISASLKFDTTKQIRLRQNGNFAGDEDALRHFNESMRPAQPQSPFISPLSPEGAIPDNSAPAPRYSIPAPTPTPFESPLTQELQRYEGSSAGAETPTFEIWYDPAQWWLTEGESGMNYLAHQSIENCTINLRATTTDGVLIASSTQLGGTWHIYSNEIDTYIYNVTPDLGHGEYTFSITLPNPLAPVNRFHETPKSECHLHAEDLFNTVVNLNHFQITPIPPQQ